MATVLVAEDSRVIRAVLRGHLEAEGYAVIEADDGTAALEQCRAVRPDVVLLDIEMPGLDGYQVLAGIKSDPEVADVPVVFLTGLTATDHLVEGLRMGAHDYLRKPFEASELIARVSAAARVKALQDELRRRNADLAAISRTDALTGLHNRRHVEERLLEVASGVRRHGGVMAVAMLDIDHFKAVNDSVGHAGGDTVLQEFARRIETSLREDDISGRWGGEEFLLVLPHTDAEGAALVVERLRALVAASPFPLDDGSALAVTVSCGCTAGDGFNAEDLVKRADDALYDAKEQGRNRVVVRN